MVLTQSDSVEVHENAIIKNRNLSPIYKRRSANKFSQKKSSNYFLRPTKRKLFSDDISSSSSSGKTVSQIEPCKINFNVQTKGDFCSATLKSSNCFLCSRISHSNRTDSLFSADDVRRIEEKRRSNSCSSKTKIFRSAKKNFCSFFDERSKEKKKKTSEIRRFFIEKRKGRREKVDTSSLINLTTIRSAPKEVFHGETEN